jgi:hypothetical protein
MQQLLTLLRTKIKTWRDNRFLKRHGCSNWKDYNYKYDTDVCKHATRLNDYYVGYPFVHCFENRKHIVYEWDVHIDGIWWISQWCDKYCKGKYRFDFHRAIKYPSTANQWEINEMGGGDYIFVAFKEERDYTWFMLKWSDDHSRIVF